MVQLVTIEGDGQLVTSYDYRKLDGQRHQRRQRHVLGSSRGVVGTSSSYRGPAATPLLVVKPNDTIGCGIDYINGVAFFVSNGVKIAGAEVPLDLTAQWRAAVASRGAAHTISTFSE